MTRLPVLFALVCFTQAAIAGGEGNAVGVSSATRSVTTPARAVSGPVQLTDAEMDKVVAGGMLIIKPWTDEIIFKSNNGSGGAAFIRDNPNGLFKCKTLCI